MNNINLLLTNIVSKHVSTQYCLTIWEACHLLLSMVQADRLVYYDSVWNKTTSFKVTLLVWRLLLNPLSTKDKLIHHGIIPHTSGLYSSSFGHRTKVHFTCLWVVHFMTTFDPAVSGYILLFILSQTRPLKKW